MDIFVEHIEENYAVCRLPDSEGNLIRLPLRELPSGTAEFKVITMRDNGTFFLNDYAREIRMKRINSRLKYRKYTFNIHGCDF